MTVEQQRDILNYLHDKYNRVEFIENDPISIPHSFDNRLDKEISGFLAATIAWGNRKAIVKSARRMMEYMDNRPGEFVQEASEREISHLGSYVHRTFNGEDFISFVRALRRIVNTYGSIGELVEQLYNDSGDMRTVLSNFYREFFMCDHTPHCRKHLSSIDKGAACKRLNMYFRWMVRRDNNGVDFGLWENIPPAALYLPLDVHSGNMGRAFGLLSRKQSDWKAVEEITATLRTFDAQDPVKYDFALFGAGIDGFLK